MLSDRLASGALTERTFHDGEPIVREGETHEGEEDPGMGIGFVYESEADRDRIAHIVEKLMVDSLGPILYEKLIGRRRFRDGD